VLFVPQIYVGTMAVFLLMGAAARRFAAPHEFAH
jgi:hypothetical protein